MHLQVKTQKADTSQDVPDFVVVEAVTDLGVISRHSENMFTEDSLLYFAKRNQLRSKACTAIKISQDAPPSAWHASQTACSVAR